MAAAAVFLALLSPAPLPAQDPGDPGGWNSPRTLELIRRTRERRQHAAADSSLRSYAADARGYVYFFLDRQDTDERVLVKVDQIALEVYWQAPGLAKQLIVGLRDEKRLPTNIRYHLDHLTVVQDDFGDLIRLGDGDEVRGVVHPAAPGSDEIYDFRLADSITIRLAGTATDIRVYEIQVRPKDLGAPAFVGSIFTDRASAAIVRMNFTFTPSAYVDRQLDYIRISLDNGLWEGKYWLPHEQRAELRRQLPELDFPVGGVIRGKISVGNYRFNSELPDGLFLGRRVAALPQTMREQFPFEKGLYAELEEQGLAPPPELAEIRRRAMELVGNHYLSGLQPLRLHLPFASAAFRYNRAEGVFAGLGFAWMARPDLRLDFHGGYAFAAGIPEATLVASHREDPGTLTLTLSHRQLRDIGPIRGASGAVNTLTALLAGDDYLDPYFASGIAISQEERLSSGGTTTATMTLRWERHDAAALRVTEPPLRSGSGFRPVRAIDEGTLGSLSLALQKRADPGLSGEGVGTLASFDGTTFAALRGTLAWRRRWLGSEREAVAEIHAGSNLGSTPRQMRYLLGGRETLPGYPYRAFTGDHFAVARAEGSTPLLHPWVRARASAATGWTELDRTADNPSTDPVEPRGTGSLRTSVGVGLGLGFDILRVDLARGLNGGSWQLLFSVNREFWDWL
ncbi:MAG: hypothetical protein HY704_09815 [Gemmatimonadetes bacterium]|nr:hypothetical protein [Gemmatimonadota bacterium]